MLPVVRRLESRQPDALSYLRAPGMTLRRYAPFKASRGTTWPPDVLARLRERDRMCVGFVVGMPGECFGALEPDHVRASGGLGMKSRSTLDNGAMLCSNHHRLKTADGRIWRPVLIDYIEGRS